MLFKFTLIKSFEIKAFGMNITLKKNDEFDFKIGYQDFISGELMAVIELLDDVSGDKLCIAVPQKVGILTRV